MKHWFLERFLPMWAKETVLKDNRQLRRDNRALQLQIDRLESYIRGLDPIPNGIHLRTKPHTLTSKGFSLS